MSFDMPDRVHIMPVGFEEERIYKTADILKADSVVLLVNRDDDDNERVHLEKVLAELRNQGFEPRIEECNIFNLYDSLGTIASLIREYSEEDVYVNISTGSKVTAIGGMIGAMINDATAYYVKASEYREGEVPKGVDDITKLPNYPIESPDMQQISILKYLKDTKDQESVTKSNLIDFSEDNSLSFISEEEISRKAKYRRLDNHIVDPLLNEGYIRVEEEGRNRVVVITEAGEEMVEAFGHMIDQFGGSSSPDLSAFN